MAARPDPPFSEARTLDGARTLLDRLGWRIGGREMPRDAPLRIGAWSPLRRPSDGSTIGYAVTVQIDPRLGVPVADPHAEPRWASAAVLQMTLDDRGEVALPDAYVVNTEDGRRRPRSSRAAFSLKAFGVYLLGLGAVLALAPNLLLTSFGFEATGEVWIRVLGVVVFNIGVYYWYAGVCEARAFFVASVYARTLVLVSFAAFAAAGLAKPNLVTFGVVDALGGAWTWIALRADARNA